MIKTFSFIIAKSVSDKNTEKANKVDWPYVDKTAQEGTSTTIDTKDFFSPRAEKDNTLSGVKNIHQLVNFNMREGGTMFSISCGDPRFKQLDCFPVKSSGVQYKCTKHMCFSTLTDCEEPKVESRRRVGWLEVLCLYVKNYVEDSTFLTFEMWLIGPHFRATSRLLVSSTVFKT